MGLFTKKDSGAHQWRGVIEEYRHRLPVSDKTPPNGSFYKKR